MKIIQTKQVDYVASNSALKYVDIHVTGTDGKTYIVSMHIAQLMGIVDVVNNNIMHSINDIFGEEDGNEEG